MNIKRLWRNGIARLVIVAAALAPLVVFSNDFYNHSSGVPATGSLASSATMRAEFDSVVAGFDKLPTVTGNANLPIFVNSGATALTTTSAATARTNLGLVIGTNVQTYDATLQSLSSLGTASDRFAYTTGVDTWAEATLTSFGRSLVDDADASAGRTTLGLGTAATQNTGTSGATVPLLNGNNTHSGTNAFTGSFTGVGGTSAIYSERFQARYDSNLPISVFYSASTGYTSIIQTLQTETASGSGWKFFDLRSAGGSNQANWYGDGSVTLGTPTGGTKGAATINTAGAIYQNNVLVPTVGANNTFSGSNTFSGATTFVDGLSISGATYSLLDMRDQNAATGYQRWRLASDSSSAFIERRSDDNSSSIAIPFTIKDGIQLGSPTGGDKGAGTLNTAGAIYQNNVLVPTVGADNTFSGANTFTAAQTFSGAGADAIFGPSGSGIRSNGNTSGVNIAGGGSTADGGRVILYGSAHASAPGKVEIFSTSSLKATFGNGASTGVQFGSPTGGDKGADTLNSAGAIYVNNVAVPTVSSSDTLSNKTISSPTLSGTITVSGTLGSSKACATNFTRITPNYCARNNGLSQIAMTRDACTAITLPAGDAKGILFYVQVSAHSNNSAPVYRYGTITAFKESSCTSTPGNRVNGIQVSAYEWSATTSTTIASNEGEITVMTTTPYLKFQDDSGDQGSANYLEIGYWD